MNALDRLVREAREASPDALDDDEVDAMVRAAAASAERHENSGLDRLLEDARQAEPVPLDELAVRRAAERAAMTGGARHRSWTRRRVMLAAGVAGALAAAAVTLAVLPRAPSPSAHSSDRAPENQAGDQESGTSTDLELATGDRLIAAPGARFRVELAEAETRAVRLDGGTMLFDVRPIEGGRFSVATPTAEVVVLGTVFTVSASERGTTVRVYEGRVQVRGASRVRIVDEGGLFHLGEGAALPDLLEARGVEAAAARASSREASLAGEAAVAAEPHAAAGELPIAEDGVTGEAAVASARGAAAAREPPPTTPAEARAWIANGEAGRALAAAERETRAGNVDPFRMLQGDALRAMGRIEEAADVYRLAARELGAPRRQQAGFLEARLRASDLDDPVGGLRALRDAEVGAPSSPLRERGLALEAELLSRLGQDAELARVARLYLREYAEGPRAQAMRDYLAAP